MLKGLLVTVKYTHTFITHTCMSVPSLEFIDFLPPKGDILDCSVLKSVMEMEVVKWRWLAFLPWEFKTTMICFSFIGLSTDFEHLKLPSEFKHSLLLPHPLKRCLSLMMIPLESKCPATASGR